LIERVAVKDKSFGGDSMLVDSEELAAVESGEGIFKEES